MDAGLSHTAEGYIPQLFVENGTPIRIYVDPGSVVGRPKLIRTLKSAGASIASDPKTADFILVQSDAATGQHFVREWSTDKKVLQAAWVSKSLSAGRLLKDSDQWGDCVAFEDPSVSMVELDQNSLPTPRITPVDGPSTSSNVYPAPHSPHFPQQPFGMSGPSFPNGNSFPDGHAFANNNNVPPLHQQPIHNQMPPFPPPPGAQQSFPPYYAPQQLPTGIAIDPNIYSLVVMDLMHQRGLLPPWGSLPGMQNGMHPGYLLPQGVNPMMNQNQAPQIHSQPPGLIPESHDHALSPAASDRFSPSFSRRSSVDLKGKGKAVAYASRGSSSSSRPAADYSPHKIFTTDSGEPLTFYVAIEVNKRSDVLSHIKRNGGQISTRTTADFAILSFRSKDFETLLETVLSLKGTPVKPAFVIDSVQQNMLLDPSQYKYELPPKVQKSGAPRSPAKTDAEKKQAVAARKARARQAKKEAVVKEERNSPAVSRPHISSPTPPPVHTRVLLHGDKYRYPEVEDDYVRSYAAVLFDRNLDMSYATLAAKIHTKMPHHTEKGWNHRLTQTLRADIEEVKKRVGIAHRKEQHRHSQRSTAEEPLAKRTKLSDNAEATQRAEVTEDASRQTVDDDDVEQDLSAVAHFFANGGDTEPSEGDEEQSEKDARVWRKLTDKTPCRTETSWEVFYNKHHSRVMELYDIIVDTQQGSASVVDQ
ncbi:hypothetical protein C8R47DRAFT_27300 [Mycena vitilis]|nr:hypothetical protein C8R47DRAFT_27300 [Mycena vitilis]